MNELYHILYKVYIRELHHLIIGYEIDHKNLQYMFDLMTAIDYIKYGNPKISEINKIIQYYE